MAQLSLFLLSLIFVSVLLIIVITLLLWPKSHIGKKVEKLMDDGNSLDEILKIGATKKWNGREVKLYFMLYTVEHFLDDGYNIIEIEKMALNAGWPRDMVDIVLNKLK